MKPAVVVTAATLAIAMALPAGAFAVETATRAIPTASMHTVRTSAGASITHRIERADVREAESRKNWYSTFPTLGFYWGRMAPRNSRLFG